MLSGVGLKKPARLRKTARTYWCAFAILIVPAAAPLANTADLVSEPIIRMNGGGIAACGLKITARDGNATFIAELYNDKTERGTRTTLSVSGSNNTALKAAAVRTADHDTKVLLRPIDDSSSKLFKASAYLDPDSIGHLFQQLLVTGFELTTNTSEQTYRWQQSGPVLHSVRQTYLMCSGDLYRP